MKRVTICVCSKPIAEADKLVSVRGIDHGHDHMATDDINNIGYEVLPESSVI